METTMHEDNERRHDGDLVDLGAATEVTQGDFLLKATEQGYIPDHWDAP
jgi:hypothetical protein